MTHAGLRKVATKNISVSINRESSEGVPHSHKVIAG
jgi:hypothetical protein